MENTVITDRPTRAHTPGEACVACGRYHRQQINACKGRRGWSGRGYTFLLLRGVLVGDIWSRRASRLQTARRHEGRGVSRELR